MELRIENINFKNGISSSGKSWEKINVQSNGQWYSCFKSSWSSGWNIGDLIECEIDEVTGKDGKIYKNLREPGAKRQSSSGEIKKEMEDLKSTVSEILKVVKRIESSLKNPALPGIESHVQKSFEDEKSDPPLEDYSEKDLPF